MLFSGRELRGGYRGIGQMQRSAWQGLLFRSFAVLFRDGAAERSRTDILRYLLDIPGSCFFDPLFLYTPTHRARRGRAYRGAAP
jgi:hypothetical protein